MTLLMPKNAAVAVSRVRTLLDLGIDLSDGMLPPYHGGTGGTTIRPEVVSAVKQVLFDIGVVLDDYEKSCPIQTTPVRSG